MLRIVHEKHESHEKLLHFRIFDVFRELSVFSSSQHNPLKSVVRGIEHRRQP
jgi:hypothetical protein